jgi:hypothetical protein
MKKMLLVIIAATMLSGFELLLLACDDDFDCDRDDLSGHGKAAAHSTAPAGLALQDDNT